MCFSGSARIVRVASQESRIKGFAQVHESGKVKTRRVQSAISLAKPQNLLGDCLATLVVSPAKSKKDAQLFAQVLGGDVAFRPDSEQSLLPTHDQSGGSRAQSGKTLTRTFLKYALLIWPGAGGWA